MGTAQDNQLDDWERDLFRSLLAHWVRLPADVRDEAATYMIRVGRELGRWETAAYERSWRRRTAMRNRPDIHTAYPLPGLSVDKRGQ